MPSVMNMPSGVTPGSDVVAATPADAAGLDESSDGFTPGPETLEMMAKLKARAHGNATVNFGSVGKNLWSQIQPLAPAAAGRSPPDGVYAIRDAEHRRRRHHRG